MRGLDQFLSRSLFPPPRRPVVADTVPIGATPPQLRIAPISARVELDWLDGEDLAGDGPRYDVADPIVAAPTGSGGGVDQAAVLSAFGALYGVGAFAVEVQSDGPPPAICRINKTTTLPDGVSIGPHEFTGGSYPGTHEAIRFDRPYRLLDLEVGPEANFQIGMEQYLGLQVFQTTKIWPVGSVLPTYPPSQVEGLDGIFFRARYAFMTAAFPIGLLVFSLPEGAA